MPIAYFSSLEEAETIEVAFVKPGGGERTSRLLVDSGFTGDVAFVLPTDAVVLAHAEAEPVQVAGALQGTQSSAVVSCRIAALSFQSTVMAILADTSTLILPPGVDGLAGLTFLRQFRRWGAEKADDGAWRFFLEKDVD
jgi:predicted aspartyl protease